MGQVIVWDACRRNVILVLRVKTVKVTTVPLRSVVVGSDLIILSEDYQEGRRWERGEGVIYEVSL